jgi:hypothetical protein
VSQSNEPRYLSSFPSFKAHSSLVDTETLNLNHSHNETRVASSPRKFKNNVYASFIRDGMLPNPVLRKYNGLFSTDCVVEALLSFLRTHFLFFEVVRSKIISQEYVALYLTFQNFILHQTPKETIGHQYFWTSDFFLTVECKILGYKV